MKTGMGLRNMGAVADRDTLTHCAVAAEEAGVDSLWVFDHLARPLATRGRTACVTPGYLSDPASTSIIKQRQAIVLFPGISP